MTNGRSLDASGILSTRIGRRFVVLFLSCALLPLLVFAWITLSSVTRQMSADLRQTLHYGAKTAGMGLAARLHQASSDLALVAELVRQQGDTTPVLQDHVAEWCGATWLVDGAYVRTLRGDGSLPLPEWKEHERAHLADGKTLVRNVGTPPQLLMVRAVDASDPGSPLVASVLRQDRLWDPEELRGPRAEFAVLDTDGRFLCHSFHQAPQLAPLLAELATDSSSGTVEWVADGERHVARYWRAFLRPQYDTDLLIVHSTPASDAFTVLDSFVRWFLLTAAATLLSVLAASLVQMRRTLGPIVSLSEATRRVAAGDLGVRVAIESQDEFGDLGRNFNKMTVQLQENVRQREQTEQELVASRDQALAAARAKAEFVTNVSHEFRTPMTEILGAAEILSRLEANDHDTRREFTGIVLQGAARLSRLFNDVLELGSTVAWKSEPTDLTASIEDALASMPRAARDRVDTDVATDLPPVFGARPRLRDAWCRLLDNAIKFSRPETRIEVRAWQHRGEIVIEFVDQGIGISPADQQRIFEPFGQVCTDQMTQKAHGTGLGLTLAKNTIQRHGGRIEVESEPGRGATFRVILPAMTEQLAAAT